MVVIDDTKITMTRGDTLSVTISMTLDSETYTPVAGDTIRFAMKHPEMNASRTQYLDDEPIITKDIPYDTCVLRLEPSDTADMDFGTYAYDIQMTYANGDVDTFIKGKFVIDPEVD